MGDTTPRFGLYRPGGGSENAHGADETADIDKLNDNFDKIDDALGVPTLANTSLFPHPYVGARCVVPTNTVPNAISGWSPTYVTWLYTQTNGWQPWDCDWKSFTPDVQGLTGTAGGNPGWTSGGRARFVGGRVHTEQAFSLVNSTSNGPITMSLPYGFDSFASGQVAPETYMIGTGVARDASDNNRMYPLLLLPINNNYVGLYALDSNAKSMSTIGNTNPFGAAWANSDSAGMTFQYTAQI